MDGYKNLMENNHTVTESYFNEAFNTMETSLALGGYRLADLISDFYQIHQLNKNNDSQKKFLGVYKE